MVIRSIWSIVEVPEHSTNEEVLTVPEDSMSINELFERAARGESLGGGYDELEGDSFFDMSHDPDFQDPLLREAIQLNKNEELQDEFNKCTRTKRSKRSSDDTKESRRESKGDKTDPPSPSPDKKVESKSE